MSFTALHRQASRTLHAAAPPDVVFPLLCPVREHEWVDGWRAVVHWSASGVAELGCVFSAHDATFVISRYEPPRAIAFVVHHGTHVQTLAIDLAPDPGGTAMTWTRVYTGLTPEGNAWIEAHVPGEIEARLGGLERMMEAYLARR